MVFYYGKYIHTSHTYVHLNTDSCISAYITYIWIFVSTTQIMEFNYANKTRPVYNITEFH